MSEAGRDLRSVSCTFSSRILATTSALDSPQTMNTAEAEEFKVRTDLKARGGRRDGGSFKRTDTMGVHQIQIVIELLLFPQKQRVEAMVLRDQMMRDIEKAKTRNR